MKLVDSREPWEVRRPLLERGWVQEALPAGDFRFTAYSGELIGIERKTGQDLMDIARTRRELQGLLEDVKVPILLIEGGLSRDSHTGQVIEGGERYSWDALWDMLATFQDGGLRLQATTSTAHTVERVNALYAYYQKPLHLSGEREKRLMGNRPAQSLLAIPGVHQEIALALTGHFGSLSKLAQATPEELEAVRLVGRKRAKAIWEHFHGKGEAEKVKDA